MIKKSTVMKISFIALFSLIIISLLATSLIK